jgi:DNA-binding transcriptional ArsR family regulator
MHVYARLLYIAGIVEEEKEKYGYPVRYRLALLASPYVWRVIKREVDFRCASYVQL